MDGVECSVSGGLSGWPLAIGQGRRAAATNDHHIYFMNIDTSEVINKTRFFDLYSLLGPGLKKGLNSSLTMHSMALTK